MSAVRTQLAILLALLVLLGASVAPLLLLSSEDAGLRARVAGFPGHAEWEGRPVELRLHGLGELDPAAHGVLVAGLGASYSAQDVARLAGFLRGGGRVLVADDSSAGIDLVARLGAGVELTSVRVYSPDFAEDPRRILARPTGAIAGFGESVPLERPTLVRGGQPVLLPPALAWEDPNGNGRPDLDEPLVRGSFAAIASFGEGALLVVGDPRAPTAVATRGPLLAWLDEDGARTLVLDESHRALSDPLGIGRATAWELGAAASTGILMLSAGVGAFVVLAPRVRRRAPRGRIHSRALPPDILAKVLGELDP